MNHTPGGSTVRPLTNPRGLWAELTDASQFGNRGEGFVAVQLLLLFLLFFPPSAKFAGAVLILTGLALMATGFLHLGENLTPLPRPRPQHSLVTTGVYSLCRHPLYGAGLLIGFGVTLYTEDKIRLIVTLLLAVLFDKKASYEESMLIERYGEQYQNYRKSGVKKLVPYFY